MSSERPPVSTYWATWVLPTSMTSAPSFAVPSRTALTLSPMPFHSWIFTSRSMPGCCFSKSAVNFAMKSSEALPFISQRVTFSEPAPDPADWEPQPVRAAAAARAVHTARKRIFTRVTGVTFWGWISDGLKLA